MTVSDGCGGDAHWARHNRVSRAPGGASRRRENGCGPACRRRRPPWPSRPCVSLAPGPFVKGRALSLRARRSDFRVPYRTPGQAHAANLCLPEEGQRCNRPAKLEVDEDARGRGTCRRRSTSPRPPGMVCTRVPHPSARQAPHQGMGGEGDHQRHSPSLPITSSPRASSASCWSPLRTTGGPFLYVLEARRAVGLARQRPAGEERPGAAEDRQARRRLAGQAGRAPDAQPELRARQSRSATSATSPGRVSISSRTAPGSSNAVEKLLEDALVKISSVLTDLHGVSGRAMHRSPDRRRARPQGPRPAGQGPCPGTSGRAGRGLRRALHRAPRPPGPLAVRPSRRPRPAHREPLPPCSTTPSQPSSASTRPLRPTRCKNRRVHPRPGYASAVERISALPGGGPDSARAVIAEIGLDMARLWHRQAGCAPGPRSRPAPSSPAARPAGPSPAKGNPYLKAALGQMADRRRQDRHLLGRALPPPHQTHAQSQGPRRHPALHTRHHLPLARRTRVPPSTDLGADFYSKRVDVRRRTDHLVHQLEALGHHVTLSPAA